MNKILFVCLYVDDIIYMSSSQDLILEFKSNMKSMFQMYALSILSYFFGLEVKQEGSGIFVTQRKHVEDLLLQFNMEDYKTDTTPMATNDKLLFDES